MRCPIPPTVPVEPQLPQCSVVRRDPIEVEINGSLQGLLDELKTRGVTSESEPVSLSDVFISTKSDRCGDFECYTADYAVNTVVTQTDAQWAETLRKHEAAMARYTEEKRVWQIKSDQYDIDKRAWLKHVVDTTRAKDLAQLAELRQRYPDV